MTCRWMGYAAQLSESYPLLITDSCCHTHFYDEFWWKTTPFFDKFLPISGKPTHVVRKICRKKDPWAAHTVHIPSTKFLTTWLKSSTTIALCTGKCLDNKNNTLEVKLKSLIFFVPLKDYL